MRDKVLMLLGQDIHSLPQTVMSKEHPPPNPNPIPHVQGAERKVQSQACPLSLHRSLKLVRQKHWLDWKIYIPRDLVPIK